MRPIIVQTPQVTLDTSALENTFDSVGQSMLNYESKDAELEVTLEAVDTEIIEISDSDSEEEIQNLDLCECEIIDEL